MSTQDLSLEPAIIVIYGITGDLAKRKLLPSIYALYENNLLSPDTKIVGVTRSGTTVDQVMSHVEAAVDAKAANKHHQDILQRIRTALSIITMDITDQAAYPDLRQALDVLEDSVGECMHRIFYLAIPSTMFEPVVERLGAAGLSEGCQHGSGESRLLIEKPFGYDLASAQELIEKLQVSFSETQIYRIDHYLAKETVQNIVTFRAQNPLFAHNWDNSAISHIMVTAAESIGIEGRVAFYEQMGALRDLIQSHLLQLVALITMDLPELSDSESFHHKKAQLLSSLAAPSPDQMATHTVRGQYDTYKNETSIAHSTTETFAALHLTIDSDRWRDVPILIRTGKAMAQKVTEITVIFKGKPDTAAQNSLTFRIQPNEGIVLDLKIKKPGYTRATEDVQMDFCYNETVTGVHPDAYERVLVDALRGDKTLFATSEEVLASWRVTEPILHAWQQNLVPLHTYRTGSWGPDASDTLAQSVNTAWLTDTLNICRMRSK